MQDMSEDSDRLSNWGRWGAQDERGAANLITPATVRAAVNLDEDGVVHSLAMPIQQRGVPVYPERMPPMHFMALDGGDYAAGARVRWRDFEVADDYIFLGTHGTTHVDALSHGWYGGKMYNGFEPTRVGSYGATRLGIENLTALVARAVVVDLPRHVGVQHLEADYVVSA